VSSTRRTAAEPVEIVRAGVPLLLLVAAILLPTIAGLFLLVLASGVAVASGRRVPNAWAWAATVPAALVVAIRAFGPAAAAWDQAACTAVSSAPVLWAVAEAALVVAAAVGLVGVLRAKAGDLALRRPPRYAMRWAVAGSVAILVVGLAGVILLAQPLLGASNARLDGAGFLVPSILFAASLAVAEEVAFRGALQGWLARSLGPWVAVLLASVVFGLAWGTWLGSPFGGVLAGAAGMILGATVVRTRTLAVALAWHAAFNVPLYLFIACRAG
jgi:uncharacterized protein